MAAKKTLKVRQTGSPIRRKPDQRATFVSWKIHLPFAV